MRNTIVASAVAPLLLIGLMTGFVGCKSAPKMPWNRTAATSDVDSAAIAHSAPSLPADIAKQAEALAATTPSINLTAPQISVAPAYTPPKASLAKTPNLAPASTTAAALMASQGSVAKASPTAYPTTGASPYTTTPTPKVPTATVAAVPSDVPPAYQSADKSANLGAINLPYNPSAVPPAKTIATTEPATPRVVGGDRYGMSSAAASSPAPAASTLASTAPAYGGATVPPVKTAAVPDFSGASRYGRYGIGRNAVPGTSVEPPAKVNLAATDVATPVKAPAYNAAATASPVAVPPQVSGNRYASTNSTVPTPPVTPSNTVPAITLPASIAPVVASASVYRPGGTTSYGRLSADQPAAEIATRPKPAAEQVPSVVAPGTTSESLQAPRYR